MRKKKARYEDFTSAKLRKIYDPFFKGTQYRKSLPGNSYVRFYYGRYSATKTYPFAFHKEIEFHYIRHGRSSYYVEGEIRHIQQKQLLVIKPNEVHGGFTVGLNEVQEKAVFIFPLDWVGMTLKPGPLPRQIVLREGEIAKLDALCSQIVEELNQQELGYEEMVKIRIQEFYCLVQRIANRPELKTPANPIVEQLKKYVDQNFAQPIKVRDLGTTFGYTQEHLTRQFKAYTGTSLKHYMLERRVMEARLLMENRPELKLTAIAEQVGFGDYSLFSRSFKLFSGMMPDTYRQLAKKPTGRG